MYTTTINLVAVRMNGLTVCSQCENWSQVYEMLKDWQKRDVFALAYAAETNHNGFVVTKETFQNKSGALRSPGPISR